ncbi:MULTISPECIES: hypothetical protein [Bacteria]|uniref:hypothetical protein n=1 Tax=Bacteria TaxID=2 RepID=UPI003C7D83FC
MNPPDSGQQIRRRTIVHGVAWTIPAIAAAVAVPSASASTCTPKRVQIDWSAFTRTDVNSGTGIGADEEGTPYPFQVSVRHGRAVQAASSNLNVWGKNTSNAMVNLTSLLSDPSYATTGDGLLSDYYSILTVNFLRPVTAVSFTVWDVDSSSSKTDRYTEHVSTSPKATRETAGSGLRRTGPTNLW